MHACLTLIDHHASQTIVHSTIWTLQIMVTTTMYVVMDQLIVDTLIGHKHQWTWTYKCSIQQNWCIQTMMPSYYHMIINQLMEENSPKVKHMNVLKSIHKFNISSKINKIPAYVNSNDLLFSRHIIAISIKPTPPTRL